MKVAPSILSVLDQDLDQVLKTLEDANVEYLHLDVMDNVFVPNITFDYNLVKELKPKTKMILDTHLMIANPDELIDEYIKTKSDYLCFHIEAAKNPKEIIKKIKDNNLKCAVSIKPNTPVSVIEPLLQDLDLVLVMSVEPGFGGQKFMVDMLEKVKLLKKLKEEKKYHYLIEMDGGLNNNTAVLAKEAGCDIIVVGTFLFNSENIKETVKELESI